MPYWLLVVHDGLATLVTDAFKAPVYLLETLGVPHDTSVGLVTTGAVAMTGAILVWVWAKVKSMLRRGAEAARQKLRREGRQA